MQPGNGKLLDNSRTRGLFTVSLLKGLGGAAAKDGKLTTNNLIDYIKMDLPKVAKQKNKVQNPRFRIDDNGDDVVILDSVESPLISLKLTFSTKDKYAILENSELNTIREGKINGEQWEVELHKGLYSIYFKGEEENAKSLRIDGTKNPINYEY